MDMKDALRWRGGTSHVTFTFLYTSFFFGVLIFFKISFYASCLNVLNKNTRYLHIVTYFNI